MLANMANAEGHKIRKEKKDRSINSSQDLANENNKTVGNH
jgi:hypothetical protein